jgi:hypothetical protein
MSEMALSSSLKSVDDSVGGKPFLFFLVSSNGLIVAAVSYDEENKYNIDSTSTPTVTNLGKSTVSQLFCSDSDLTDAKNHRRCRHGICDETVGSNPRWSSVSHHSRGSE